MFDKEQLCAMADNEFLNSNKLRDRIEEKSIKLNKNSGGTLIARME